MTNLPLPLPYLYLNILACFIPGFKWYSLFEIYIRTLELCFTRKEGGQRKLATKQKLDIQNDTSSVS